MTEQDTSSSCIVIASPTAYHSPASMTIKPRVDAMAFACQNIECYVRSTDSMASRCLVVKLHDAQDLSLPGTSQEAWRTQTPSPPASIACLAGMYWCC